MKVLANKSNRILFFLPFILLIALSIRIWGINYDLPYIYHPDEPGSIITSQNIFKTGDLNPYRFDYPSLFFYVNAFAYIPYYFAGKILGIFSTRNDIVAPILIIMGTAKSQQPGIVILGRMISVLFGVGTVGLTYAIGKQLTGKSTVGLIAALMLALAYPAASLNRFITPDTLVVFLATAAFLASILIYKQGKTRFYIIAGICVGLTASTKYNGAFIVLPLILAHFLRHGWLGIKNRNLYIALLMCGLGFIIGTPYAVLDFPGFLAGLQYQNLHYSTGHAGMEGNTLTWYLTYMWRTGSVIYFLSLLGIIYGIYRMSPEIILLSIFPIVYFIFISSFFVRNDRTFLPLIPFLFLLAAYFMEVLFNKISLMVSRKWRIVALCGFYALLAFTIVLPGAFTVKKNIELTSTNSRETSRVWIIDNLPPGSKIALESYSPFVDPQHFNVQGFVKMIDQPPDWYVKNGFEYLVFSQGMYGRYFDEPDRYSSEILQYNNFFNHFKLLKSFNDGNLEIRIYKVSS